MSVESEILRIQRNIANAYAVAADKGGEVPLQPTSANLAAAVASIPVGRGSAGGVPVGSIIIWSGAADSIPAGWALCDGQESRPDLRDRFVLGAGTSHAVGETGGSETVTLTLDQMPAHTHYYNGYTTMGLNTNGNNTCCIPASAAKTNSNGSSMPHPNMPPYYTLCYIIKITADETDCVTMEQVNAAIDAAVTGAIRKVYYGTGNAV